MIFTTPYQYYRTSILSTSSLASLHVSTFFFAQSMWHLAYAIFRRRLASSASTAGEETYHVSLEILFFLQLESFEVLQNTCACVFDILFRHTESLFKLGTRQLKKKALATAYLTWTKLSLVFIIWSRLVRSGSTSTMPWKV